jgi:hypothetical protein
MGQSTMWETSLSCQETFTVHRSPTTNDCEQSTMWETSQPERSMIRAQVKINILRF